MGVYRIDGDIEVLGDVGGAHVAEATEGKYFAALGRKGIDGMVSILFEFFFFGFILEAGIGVLYFGKVIGPYNAAFFPVPVDGDVGGCAEEIAFDGGLDVDGGRLFPEFEKCFLYGVAGVFVVVEYIQCDEVHGM